MTQVDYSRLTPEVRQLLEEAEQNSPENRQLVVLNGLAEFLKLLVDGVNQLSNETLTDTEQVTQGLSELRDTVKEFQSAMPELPDYSKPIVSAVDDLQKSLTKEIKKLELSPTIEGPNVSVEAPAVDLSGVEKVIKKDLSKAFNDAIKSIPKTEVNVPETDLTVVEERLSEMLEWLQSIDTASRMKVQFPTQLKVVNPDGTYIGPPSLDLQVDDTGTYTYLGNATPGTATSAASWRIKRVTNATGVITHADGSSSFIKVWDDRASYSY